MRSHFGFAITFSALAYGKMVCFSDSAATAIPIISFYGIGLAIISVHQLSELAEVQSHHFGGLSSLREIQAGGATISNELMQQIRATVPCALYNTYASTEAGTAAFASVEQLGELRSEGAVGFVTPWANVEAHDSDGQLLPRGHDGNLYVSALGMAAPYEIGMKTVESTHGFYPGDYGRVLSDGMLVIGGRSTEIINIGGNKVAPEKLEQIVLQCAGVRDAAVFAVDANAALPQIWAVVVADGQVDATEIMRRCGEISRVATPTVIKTIASIPRNATGKIMRDQLRRELAGQKD
jgi:acyl-coenzyme A synthetase/AMP-(fatty) acid ligase